MSKIKQQSTIKDMILATIEEHVDAQNEKGMKKYGQSIDDCPVGDYDWQQEIIQELVDALQYQQKEIGRLNESLSAPVEKGDTGTVFDEIPSFSEWIKGLELINEHDRLINQARALGFRVSDEEDEQSPSEALNDAVEDYKGISERDETIEDLEDEIKELEWRVKELKEKNEIVIEERNAAREFLRQEREKTKEIITQLKSDMLTNLMKLYLQEVEG